MRCRRVRALLPLMLDGALPESQERAVQAHIARCSHCARLVRSVARPLPPLPPIPPQALEVMHRRLDATLDARRLDSAPHRHRASLGPSTRRTGTSLAWVAGILAGATAAGLLVLLSSPAEAPDAALGPREAPRFATVQEAPGSEEEPMAAEAEVAGGPAGSVGLPRPAFAGTPGLLIHTQHSAFLGLRPVSNLTYAGMPGDAGTAGRLEMDVPPWLPVGQAGVRPNFRTQ